jgi:hypothetical protein
LNEVIAPQKNHVEKVCSRCDIPCCTRVSRLFDEKDPIVIGMNGVPSWSHKGKKGCPHLSTTGCLLEPNTRPFTCHRYLCPELKEEMIREDPGLVSLLERKYRTLEQLRAELLGEFIKVHGIGSKFLHVGRTRRERNQDCRR